MLLQTAPQVSENTTQMHLPVHVSTLCHPTADRDARKLYNELGKLCRQQFPYLQMKLPLVHEEVEFVSSNAHVL